jgi:hypothetical protein
MDSQSRPLASRLAAALGSAATGRTGHQVRQALARLPDTEYDETGRIIGYGITLDPTPHRFEVDGRRLYTWCALDTLIFPAVLCRAARVADAFALGDRRTPHLLDGPDPTPCC